jgi:cephalosporin-C deacetylase-like acetyl esterase
LGKLQGSNKSASPVIAAYLGLSKDKKPKPGIVHVHGGGQRANRRRVEDWMKLGYACVSINWGGKVLEKAKTANTDWDGLAGGGKSGRPKGGSLVAFALLAEQKN